MPARQNKLPPRPEVMTWGKALPVLILCGIFDTLRFMCEQLWLFGPALIGVVAGLATGSSFIGYVAGILGAGAELVTGPTVEIFGVVMAMAIGLAGWGTVGLILFMFNPRIFKENQANYLWVMLGLFVSEVPVVGSLPALTITIWRAYRTQIKKEKQELRKWEAEQAAFLKQQRDEQVRQALAMRDAQIAQEEARVEAANDTEEIPEEQQDTA